MALDTNISLPLIYGNSCPIIASDSLVASFQINTWLKVHIGRVIKNPQHKYQLVITKPKCIDNLHDKFLCCRYLYICAKLLYSADPNKVPILGCKAKNYIDLDYRRYTWR